MFVGGVEGEGSRRPIVAMWMDTSIVSKGCDFDVSQSPGENRDSRQIFAAFWACVSMAWVVFCSF